MNKLICFNTLEEFKERGFVLLNSECLNKTIENNLQDILIAKRITISELSRKTGVSKQVISKSIVNNSKINLDSAMKISIVLETPIEKIFHLNENAWIDIYTIEGKTVYLNMQNLKMMNSHEKNEYLKKYGNKYYNPVTGEVSKIKVNEEYIELFMQIGKRLNSI